MTKHYLSLTNGIDWLEDIKALNQPYSFVRIQSTTIERKNWIKLFLDLDHDFLLNLAIGTECVLYDCGTNRPFSKTIYYGVPLIKYVLNRKWFGIIPDKVYRLNRGGSEGEDVSKYFDHIYNELFRYNQDKQKEAVKTKLNFYKKFLNCESINLVGMSRSTDKDGDYNHHRELLLKNI